MGVVLFPHNYTAYERVQSMLAERGKAAVIHPTGTGKSYIAFKLAEDHPDHKFLWLSPSEYIFESQMDSLHRSTPGFFPGNITCITYAKLMQMGAPAMEELEADYIILDEFHRCGARQWGRGVEALLAKKPGAKLLGLTATNVRYLDNRRDMAQELFSGCVASRMSLGEAIVRGILPAPLYVTSLFQWQGELSRYEQRVARQKDKARRARSKAYLEQLRRTLERSEGLDMIFRKYLRKGEKYIVFCSGVEHMKRMLSQAGEWFSGVDSEVHCYAAFSENPASSREFADFARDASDHLKLLFCIDMLNEGVHVDGVSGVILFRPTASPIIYKQQVGRALTAGSMRTPVILDIVDCQGALSSVGSIRAEMEEAAGRFRRGNRPDLVVQESFQVIEHSHDCRVLFEKLERELGHSWDDYYEAACWFAREYGHLRVPVSYVAENGLQLGQWVAAQKSIQNGASMGSLSREQVQRLEAIGMDWRRHMDYCWDTGYQEARDYYEVNGNLAVKSGYVSGNGFALGRWLDRQRKNRAVGRRLTDGQVARLDAIGMDWDGRFDTQFSEGLACAGEYYREHGNLMVPVSYCTPQGFRLGQWISELRKRHKNGELDQQPERTRSLEEIGMVWDVNAYKWQEKYKEALAYYREHGSAADVPTRFQPLYKWVSSQKRNLNSGKLTRQQTELLRGIGIEKEPDAVTE